MWNVAVIITSILTIA
ncbi:hypothetical protein AVEN_270510-1, partial [Araneus ventricosus]